MKSWESSLTTDYQNQFKVSFCSFAVKCKPSGSTQRSTVLPERAGGVSGQVCSNSMLIFGRTRIVFETLAPIVPTLVKISVIAA